MKKIAIMCIWDFTKYDDEKTGKIKASTPLTFGYVGLKNRYDVHVITHNEKTWLYKFLKVIFKDDARSIMIQLMCCNLDKKGYDLIYYPVDRHAMLLGLLRKVRLIKLPILMMNHFSFNTNYIGDWKKRLYIRAERFVLFHSIDQIVFPGEKIMQIALEDYKIPEKHQIQVGWGADLSYFDEGIKNKRYANETEYYMAAGSANRDYDTLLKAFSKIDARLKLFGNGSAEFKKYSDNSPQNVKIYNLRNEGIDGEIKIRDYYCSAKAVLIPILQKNDVPNGATVLVEALAAGKPVVVTDMDTNFVDVVSEGIGLTVPIGDIDGWIKAINFLETHPEELARMSANARSYAEKNYNYKKMTENLIKIIDGM